MDFTGQVVGCRSGVVYEVSKWRFLAGLIRGCFFGCHGGSQFR